jgi:hypothetical protein
MCISVPSKRISDTFEESNHWQHKTPGSFWHWLEHVGIPCGPFYQWGFALQGPPLMFPSHSLGRTAAVAWGNAPSLPGWESGHREMSQVIQENSTVLNSFAWNPWDPEPFRSVWGGNHMDWGHPQVLRPVFGSNPAGAIFGPLVAPSTRCQRSWLGRLCGWDPSVCRRFSLSLISEPKNENRHIDVHSIFYDRWNDGT